MSSSPCDARHKTIESTPEGHAGKRDLVQVPATRGIHQKTVLERGLLQATLSSPFPRYTPDECIRYYLFHRFSTGFHPRKGRPHFHIQQRLGSLQRFRCEGASCSYLKYIRELLSEIISFPHLEAAVILHKF